MINALDVPTKARIKTQIEKIPKGDIKLILGYSDGRKRLRVGKYRIIFIESNTELFIIEIGSRGDVYK